MHVNEFLNRTDRRNRNTRIEWEVKQVLGKCAEDLDRRRQELSELLQRETCQLELELSELQRAQLQAAQNQRIEWIQMSLLRQAEQEQRLLQLKQQQREIENSEAHRHEESRQILLASKQSQLYQIEERKQLRRRAAQLEASVAAARK